MGARQGPVGRSIDQLTCWHTHAHTPTPGTQYNKYIAHKQVLTYLGGDRRRRLGRRHGYCVVRVGTGRSLVAVGLYFRGQIGRRPRVNAIQVDVKSEACLAGRIQITTDRQRLPVRIGTLCTRFDTSMRAFGLLGPISKFHTIETGIYRPTKICAGAGSARRARSKSDADDNQ